MWVDTLPIRPCNETFLHPGSGLTFGVAIHSRMPKKLVPGYVQIPYF
jgi:hypothetical protein